MDDSNALDAGLYARLIDERLRILLKRLDDSSSARESSVEGELARELSMHVSMRLLDRFAQMKSDDVAGKVELCNRLLAVLGEEDSALEDPPRRLDAVDGVGAPQVLPTVPLGANNLITNSGDAHGLSAVVNSEVPSAESIDLVCAFVKWSGLRLVRDVLSAHVEAGRPFRVLTTTYMGASDPSAVEALERMGASVRVCYEQHATRLHAKAWLFERPRRGTTALVGSSNMSHSALMDGMEWNVRLTQRRAPDVVARFREVFDAYWDDPVFEPFDAARFAAEIEAQQARVGVAPAQPFGDVRELRPYAYQEVILEKLEVERVRHGRHCNLVVAATGVGKTMIAAFDFARWRAANPDGTLLFVAHREDILKQSLRTFRAVLKEPGFGELYVGGSRPGAWTHVFASIQSLTRGADTIEGFEPDAFDVVIVDECHHIGAESYGRVLDHCKPMETLGLTATPERADGKSILGWFGGRIAAEMRLWDALRELLLVPFHYFALDDGTDLTGLEFERGRYAVSELEGVYTADDIRAKLVIEQVERFVEAPERMRAIGFCVSIAHAEFMAKAFDEAGWSAMALSSNSTRAQRDAAPGRLARGELQAIFTVDLYNEGVDIPSVDTLLMLRPTESATVFLQQLGRGLRHAPGKACVTVLDFVGHMHAGFDLSGRYATLTGRTRAELAEGLDEGSLFLPSGCVVELDRVTTERVLEHIRTSVDKSLSAVSRELAAAGDVTMGVFLERTGMGVDELYKSKAWWWTKLRARAGVVDRTQSAYQAALSSALSARIHRLVHVDDSARLALYRDVLSLPQPPDSIDETEHRAMLGMLVNQTWGKRKEAYDSLEAAVAEFWESGAARDELVELFGVLEERASYVTRPLGEVCAGWPDDAPVSLHGAYTREEVLTALGAVELGEASGSREGVWRDDARKLELLFVTLGKDPDRYAPEVRYKDHPIGTTKFHWETQNSAAPHTKTGKRYIGHVAAGWTMVLFVRGSDKDGRNINGAPFRCLGPVTYERHTGSKPMSIVWKLAHEMPHGLFDQVRHVS